MSAARALVVRRRWYVLVPFLFGIGFGLIGGRGGGVAATLVWVVVTAAIGLSVGLIAAALSDRFDDRLYTARALQSATRLPVAAVIPGTAHHGVRVVTLDEASSREAGAYRSLADWIDRRWTDSPTRRIFVVGPTPGVGASAVAANLAVVHAQAGRSVVLVDLNLQQPSVQRYFPVHNERGLVALLTGSTLAEVVRTVPMVPGLSIIPAGTHAGMSDGWLRTAKVGDVLEALGAIFDVCVIDGAPVSASDPSIVTQHCDGGLLVVASAETVTDDAAHASSVLAIARAPMLGTVLNGYRRSESGYPYEVVQRQVAAAPAFSRPARRVPAGPKPADVHSGSTADNAIDDAANESAIEPAAAYQAPLGWSAGDEVAPNGAVADTADSDHA